MIEAQIIDWTNEIRCHCGRPKMRGRVRCGACNRPFRLALKLNPQPTVRRPCTRCGRLCASTKGLCSGCQGLGRPTQEVRFSIVGRRSRPIDPNAEEGAEENLNLVAGACRYCGGRPLPGEPPIEGRYCDTCLIDLKRLRETRAGVPVTMRSHTSHPLVAGAPPSTHDGGRINRGRMRKAADLNPFTGDPG